MRRVRFKCANARSKGEEEERKGRGWERKRKGKREREIGSEALAETEKIANAPAGNRTRDPSKRGWCSTIKPPSLPISLSLFPFLFLSHPLPFLSSSSPFDLAFAHLNNKFTFSISLYNTVVCVEQSVYISATVEDSTCPRELVQT